MARRRTALIEHLQRGHDQTAEHLRSRTTLRGSSLKPCTTRQTTQYVSQTATGPTASPAAARQATEHIGQAATGPAALYTAAHQATEHIGQAATGPTASRIASHQATDQLTKNLFALPRGRGVIAQQTAQQP